MLYCFILSKELAWHNKKKNNILILVWVEWLFCCDARY